MPLKMLSVLVRVSECYFHCLKLFLPIKEAVRVLWIWGQLWLHSSRPVWDTSWDPASNKTKNQNILKSSSMVHFLRVKTKHGREQNNTCLMFIYGHFVVSKTGLPMCRPQVQGLCARLAGHTLYPSQPQPPIQLTKTPRKDWRLALEHLPDLDKALCIWSLAPTLPNTPIHSFIFSFSLSFCVCVRVQRNVWALMSFRISL